MTVTVTVIVTVMAGVTLRFSLYCSLCCNHEIILILHRSNTNVDCKDLHSHSAPASQVLANDLDIVSSLLKFCTQPFFEMFELDPVV
jgi:hypothetical protein